MSATFLKLSCTYLRDFILLDSYLIKVIHFRLILRSLILWRLECGGMWLYFLDCW